MPLLPVQTEHHLGFREWLAEDLDVNVHQILKQEVVHYYEVGIVRRKPINSRLSDSPQNKTIIVLADISVDNAFASWKKAARRLQELLINKGRDDVNVEIVDSRAAWCFEHSVVEDDQTVEAWEGMRSKIVEELGVMDWHSIDVVKRCLGQVKPPLLPTVYITASDAEKPRWWDVILPRLRSTAPADFQFEVILGDAFTGSYRTTGQTPRVIPELEPESFTDIKSYGQRVPMGSSIGVTPEWSGTTGGYMELRDDKSNEVIHCAITNHHVEKHPDAKVEVGTPITRTRALVEGRRIAVHSPSAADHERLQHTLAWRIEQYLPVDDPEGFQKDGADLNTINASDEDARLLGHILATSGYRGVQNPRYNAEQVKKFSKVRDLKHMQTKAAEKSLAERIQGQTLDWGVDWALVRTDSRQVSRDTPRFAPMIRVPHFATADEYQILDPKKSYKVAKFGRTSKWTTGKIGRIGSVLNLRYDRISVVPAEIKTQFGKIVLAYGILSDDKNGKFLAPGDSGSLILLQAPTVVDGEKKATIVGLGFAANPYSLVSYMAPMDLVIKYIEYVTGCTVTVPALVQGLAGDEIQSDEL
jgi:hypothetical protein